jgi:competence protein ComEA
MSSMSPAQAPGPPARPPALEAWPRPAQAATAALLLLATLLLLWHGLGSLPGGSRPAELHSAAPARRVDLNRADRAELLQLPGIGDGLAERIEDYRREHGGFRDVDDLHQVRGVGPTLLERLRPWVSVRDEDAGEEKERTGKPAASPAPRRAGTGTRRSTSSKAAKLTGPVNVNRATAAALQTLPGIGPKLAQRILDERARGRFRSVDDLRRVPGIGPKTLERLRPHVIVGGEPVKVAATGPDDAAD